jgi:hypothetical protein
MPELDQITARAPATWTGELVKLRMLEAFTIEQKLPADRHFIKKVTTAWPAQPLTEFHEMVGWDEGETRLRNWQSWENAKGAFSYEISRMEEAFGWLRWLSQIECDYLTAWALGKIKGTPRRKILRKHGAWTKTTFYRTIDNAVQLIATRLNGEGVQVR